VYEGGKYVQVAFELQGSGQFVPVAEAGASPHTGSAGKLERVLEYRVEILCEGRDVAKAAVAGLKKYVRQHGIEPVTTLTAKTGLIRMKYRRTRSTSWKICDEFLQTSCWFRFQKPQPTRLNYEQDELEKEYFENPNPQRCGRVIVEQIQAKTPSESYLWKLFSLCLVFLILSSTRSLYVPDIS
jgi:hypothetical protein